MSLPQTHTEGGIILAQGWWGPRSSEPWRSPTSHRERSRHSGGSWGWDWEDAEEPPPKPETRSTYRTLCVRLCDGFYWPISFATTPQHFDRDRRKCEASCGSPARLYTYRNPGGNPEDMEDLSGKPYSRLKTAFAYRTNYNESCKCKSDPWQQEAMERHRVYALEAAKKKGDKAAARQLAELKDSKTAVKATPGRSGETAPLATLALIKTDTPGAEADSELAPEALPPKAAGKLPPALGTGRMSLGARAAPAAKPSAAPARIWRNTADNAP